MIGLFKGFGRITAFAWITFSSCAAVVDEPTSNRPVVLSEGSILGTMRPVPRPARPGPPIAQVIETQDWLAEEIARLLVADDRERRVLGAKLAIAHAEARTKERMLRRELDLLEQRRTAIAGHRSDRLYGELADTVVAVLAHQMLERQWQALSGLYPPSAVAGEQRKRREAVLEAVARRAGFDSLDEQRHEQALDLALALARSGYAAPIEGTTHYRIAMPPFPRSIPPRLRSIIFGEPGSTSPVMAAAALVEDLDFASLMPQLMPWPPPSPSARLVLERALVDPDKDPKLKFGDVDGRLTGALQAAGYGEIGYLGVPGGFAIVTAVERFEPNRDLLDPESRWSTRLPPLQGFSLVDYIRALFHAERGHFRVLVFVVTDQPFAPADNRIRLSTVESWARQSVNVLPRELARLPYGRDHVTTVLVYEFERPRGAGNATVVAPGLLQGLGHLQHAGIYAQLTN